MQVSPHRKHQSIGIINSYSNSEFKIKKAELEEESPQIRPQRKASNSQIVTLNQILVPKNIGFTNGFIPVNKPTRIVSSVDLTSKCPLKAKKYGEMSAVKNTHEVDQRLCLGLSHSDKKWIWSGSNGKMKGGCIDGWHKYIELSQKIVT